MNGSVKTPPPDSTSNPRLSDSASDKPCPSTDCEWKFDLLCAPRPRARTRLNESGFFDEDTKSVAGASKLSGEEANTGSNREVIFEDWASASSYSNEIFSYLYALENKFLLRKDFLTHQDEVTFHSRAVLVDWLIQVHEFYNFPQDCLYLMISLLDRYMSLHYVPLTHFQLLGMASLLVACKYEDRFVPSHGELVTMADKAFSSSELTQMERHLLESLDYDLSMPLPSHFLRRFARSAGTDAETYALAKFLMELTQLDLMLVTHKPSLVAASAFCLASGLVWENGVLSDSVPGSCYTLGQLKPCLVRTAQLIKLLKSLGCMGIVQKYCGLGIDSTVMENLALNPIVQQLTAAGGDWDIASDILHGTAEGRHGDLTDGSRAKADPAQRISID